MNAIRPRPTFRFAGLALVVSGTVSVMTACSSPNPEAVSPTRSAPPSTNSASGAPSKATASSPTTTGPTTTDVASSSTPSSGASASGPATSSNCRIEQLSVSAAPPQGATGHIAAVVVFRNISDTSCQLAGYPGVAGLDAAGTQQVQAGRTLHGFMGGVPDGSTPPVVTLTPGQSASATVEGTTAPSGPVTACPTFPALLVTPPNETRSVTVAVALPGCSPLQVHPVVNGTAGSIGP